MKNIIICATQRCGSTMLCEDFRLTAVLGEPEEYFIPWKKSPTEEGTWAWKIENNPELSWCFLLEKMLKNKVSKNGVFAAKVMADQIEFVDNKLMGSKCVEVGDQQGLCPYFYETFKKFVWVRISREDTLKQAISREMARQTRLCHATIESSVEHFAGQSMSGYKKNYNVSAKYKHECIKEHYKAILAEEEKWDTFFNDWGLEVSNLKYEDIVDNREYLYDIGSHVGVDIESVPDRISHRMSNSVNDAWYEKYMKIESAS